MTKLPPRAWHSAWTILCDFDGTISSLDVTDTLLEHFGKPGWSELEERWLAGDIGSQECMAGQIALLDMSREELDEVICSIPIDPDFRRFVELTQHYEVPLHVVSDGLDYPIYRLLERQSVTNVPVVANLLEQVGDRSWHLRFPWKNEGCRTGSGVCKCAVMHQRAENASLLIGDGHSDFCLAHEATHVFARGSLLAECRKDNLPHTPVSNFAEACTQLEILLGNPESHLPIATFNALTPWKQR
ncbi:2-hydroxy-3-keto-5-methylthiopentenyl-1-phosphate phosphatase [Salmonella enterica subsp. enterica serovar Choleraesuis]|nr:2-hydroxy-3-keto-5-methylthiopentenyl-1-phosphate phosphatase [Salmonella enterica subsp. enterica serovar Choleraesuis]